MRPLREAGIEVLIVHQLPYLPDSFAPMHETAAALWLTTDWGRVSASRSGLELVRKGTVDAETSAANRTGSQHIDLFDSLCPGGTCSASDSIGWLYRDFVHISVDASHRMTPHLKEAMLEALQRV